MTEVAQSGKSGMSESGKMMDLSTGLNGQEVEVKFRTDSLGLKRVLSAPLFGAADIMKSQSLRSIYFDTRDGDVRKNGLVLRLRKKGRTPVSLCLKWTDPNSDGP